jgi:hypothetical protein
MAIDDTRKRWLALYALRLASLMIVLDMTIANVVQGAIRSEPDLADLRSGGR